MRRALLALILIMPPLAASADDRVPPVRDPLVLKECGECHMAFQPAFLPARSWERLMDTLSDHFGDDATLPPTTAAAIRRTLVAGAGRAGGAPSRITETRFFRHEHDFPDRVWNDPKVVTRSNCPACHRGAERGVYEDD
ncbi:MAG: diheme cytochrome c [Alphaproteobacteria bacterium]|nr:diheme cytochrome c [Alphaproteobacteria bacterium]